MKIKRIEELSHKELTQRMSALDPLCNWDSFGMPTNKELFMMHQWGRLEAERINRDLRRKTIIAKRSYI